MAKAYWINTFRSVRDPQQVAAYIDLAGPVRRESGGSFLARGTAARVFESGVIERTVVIEFDSDEQAVAAYESPRYQEELRTLADGDERDLQRSHLVMMPFSIGLDGDAFGPPPRQHSNNKTTISPAHCEPSALAEARDRR